MAFAIDYLRVGDEPNAIVYQTLTTSEMPAAGGTTPSGVPRGPNETVFSMESKHFRFLWNNTATSNPSWTANMPRGTLRNLEETWQVYAKKLGYLDPSLPWRTTTGTRYKLNASCWYDGYWAGGDSFSGVTISRLNITPDGLRVNPPSTIVPHELMHCFQFYNDGIGNANRIGYMVSEWWEFHANYGRERWYQHYQALYPNESGIDPTYLRCAHQKIDDGRDFYLTWPFFIYLDENPDALTDLGEGTVLKLWQQTRAGEYPMMTLERLTPTSSLKDIVGYFARRGLTYNYSTKTAINASLADFGPPLDNEATARWQLTDLVQRPDDPTWWRVPYEMAPQQGAYAIHELVVPGSGTNGRTVTVNLRGLADAARGADWRASFIVISNDGSERYSTLWGSGNNSVTLSATENKLYLSVAGAPATFYYGGSDDVVSPYRSDVSKTRFPYEIQVTGATPKQRDNGTTTTGLVQHSNGGGYKASGVFVPSTVYIGPNARVFGGSVSGNARIEDYAVVSDFGTVNGNAVVSGHAWVRGGTVNGDAKVRDWALVEGGTITGSARVIEHGNIKGGTVQDIVTAKGTAASLSGTLSGNAIIDGNYGDFFSGRNVANGVAFGHVPFAGVPNSHIRALPSGLYASYDFATAHDSRILDKPGVTDGFTVGSPTWISADAKRKAFLSFDGASQHVNLDKSVADLREWTFTAWVKPLGGAANQAVLWAGATSTKRLFFTPDDGTGKAKFSIVNGGGEQKLVSSSALPTGIWSHVAVTLNGTTGVLYINGTEAANGAIALRADQVLAANTATALQHIYLARSEGAVMPRFRGALDDVQFYAKALTASEVSAFQPATTVASAGTLYVDLRAADASAGAATWINNGSIGDFTAVNSPTKLANVLGTGAPGVQFNGTSQAYGGPNTVADLDGASDRSIEAWVYNPAVADQEALVSWAYRGGSPDGSLMSLNYGSSTGYGATAHWGGSYDLGWAAPPDAGTWHHLAYTYDGATTAKVYVDGTLTTSKTLPSALATWAGQPINLACQRNSDGTRARYFSGFINCVRVHGGVLNAAQIAGNYSLGPVGATNSTPTLATISDQVVNYGTSSVAVPLTMADSDTPLAVVTLSGNSANESLVADASISFSGSTGSRTASIVTVPGVTGTTAITLVASDGSSIATRVFNLTVLTPLETWRKQKFGTSADTGDGADKADSDRDGLFNLIEYATGTDPMSANPATGPEVAITEGKLTIAFTRSIAAIDVTLSVVAANSPEGPWTEIARSVAGAPFTDNINGNPSGAVVGESGEGEVKSVQVSDVNSASASSKRFLRLEVSH